jgi:hypothetical protein
LLPWELKTFRVSKTTLSGHILDAPRSIQPILPSETLKVWLSGNLVFKYLKYILKLPPRSIGQNYWSQRKYIISHAVRQPEKRKDTYRQLKNLPLALTNPGRLATISSNLRQAGVWTDRLF